jgi:drug/metabolite transporter (DMT)-like permease
MEPTVTPTSTKGIVIGLILVVLALITYFMDIKVNGPLQWVGYAIFIGGIIWSVMSYGKQVNHNSTFGNYFAHGFKVAALVTAIMLIYVIIFIVLFPEFKEKAIDEARKSMQSKNNLSEEQIKAGLEMTRKFFMVFLVGGTLLGYLFFGALASLIGAAVTKKEPNNFAGDINEIGQ